MADELSYQVVRLASEFQQQHGDNDQIKKIVALIEQRKRKLNNILSSEKTKK